MRTTTDITSQSGLGIIFNTHAAEEGNQVIATPTYAIS